jgi:hypothetical protein
MTHANGPLDRRAFVQTAVRTAVAAGVAVPALSALAAAGASDDGDPLVTGSGDFRYRVEHDWLVPPPSIRWGDTHGLAQDKSGRIYVSHTVGAGSEKKDAIVVFSGDGKFLTSWGERFAGGGHGLDLREENGVEYLYHCDVNRRKLAKTALDGTLVWEVGAPVMAKARDQACYANEGEWNPTNVCFAPDGDVFVGDGYGKSFVHRFGADGAWKATLTTPGSAAGETSCPHGLWVDARRGEPTLVVADRGNHRLQRFTLEGKHLGFETEGMRQPCHLKTRGEVLLVPDLASVVTLVGPDGKVLASLGDGHPTTLRGKPRTEYLPGKFIHPHGSIFLADGSILVAEWVPDGRITRLVPVKA